MNIKTINPYTNKEIKTYALHSNEEIDQIIENVYNSYFKWKKIPFDIRESFLLNISNQLECNVKQYAEIITNEMGKPIAESIAEVKKSALVCDYYAKNAKHFLNSDYIETENSNSYVKYDPLGIIFGIMPWNFPFWQVFRFIAPALMAGNVCLLKHASNVSQCSIAINSLINEYSPIKNIFRNLLIHSNSVDSIICDKRIAAVTLTGSEIAGASVAKSAGKNLKKCVLELGGSDPFIVLADADIKQSAKSAINGRFFNSGQSCIAAKRFIVHKDIYENFVNEIKIHFKSLKIGDPLDLETNIGPLAKIEFAKELDCIVQDSIQDGANLVLGGGVNKCFYEPTLLTDVTSDMLVFKNETFGPVMSICKAKTNSHAIELANKSDFGLSSSIWTSDINYAEKITSDIDCGAVFINKISHSDPRLPFGGIKKSGYGRELSKQGIMEFINCKTVVVG